MIAGMDSRGEKKRIKHEVDHEGIKVREEEMD